MLKPETIALLVTVSAYIVAAARLFNVARPLYGWIPAKAQPVVIALAAGLPQLAEALLVSTTTEHLVTAVGSAVVAFLVAAKGAPPAPPSSGAGSGGATLSGPGPVQIQPWPNSPDEPAELSDLAPKWRHPYLRFAVVALALLGCDPRKPPCDETKLRAVDERYVSRVLAVCLPKHDRKEDCPEWPALEADHRRELREACP